MIQSSSDNLTIFNNAVGLRLLGGSAPLDLLLDPRLGVLGSYMFWEARANIGGVWTSLVPSSNTFTVLGTNATGTFVTRTMQVNSGSYSGTLTVAYKATSKGPLKWDLGFSPKNTGQYELVYSWEDLTGQLSLLSPARQFSMNSARGNYTFSWSDVSSTLNANASLARQLFVLSIDLGIVTAGSRMQVDPSIVSPSVPPGASAYTFQRKVFYDAKGGYYWVFYYNGYQVGYRYSSDGMNWSPFQNMPTNVPSDSSGGPFYLLDIRNMGQYVVAAAGESITPGSTGTVSIGYVVGTISGSTINWGATNYLGWNATCETLHPYCTFGVRYVSSTLNPDGSLAFSYNWFGNYTQNRCGNGFVDAQSGVFAIYNGHNVVLSCNSGTGNYVGEQDRSVVLPADQNGVIRVVYEFHSGSQVELLSQTVDKNGSVGNVEIIDGSIADTDQFSATTDASFGVHVLYLTTSGKVNYAYLRPSDASWSQPALDLFSGNANYPTITTDYSTNNVYAFAIQSSSVAMRERQSGRSWLDDSIIFPVTNQTNPTNLGSSYASASSTNSTYMSLIYTAGTGPYDLTFARIPLETVWSPYSAPSDPWDGEGIAPYGRYFANLGEYVSPSSGLLAVRQTDLTLPGRGLNLVITRVFTEPYSFLGGIAYNYESYPWAPMGNGWQLDFPWMMNATATYFPMFIHLSEGQGYRIPRSFWTTALPTAFENHEGLHFRMVRNGTGVFLYDAAGIAYKFDPNSAYRLTSEIDPLGNNVTFSYNANNQISSIRDTVGRTFLFCYASGRVTAIEQSGGSCGSETNFVRKVAFDYIGTALIVHDAAGRKTTYQYWGTSGSDQWLISQITYPTGWYTAYTYWQRSLGSQAVSSRVSRQKVYAGPTSPIRQFIYGYTQGPGDQVIGSSVGSVDGTTLVSATYYAFSFAGVTWNITDGSYNFVRGYQQMFGTGGEVTRETVLVSKTQGYTSYYSYDLWGNRIYSRSVINPSANWYHESFNTYYNDGLPPGFNALQETFGQGNFSATDNHWSVYNGTWLVKNGVYNGTSLVSNPTNRDSLFAWTNFTSPSVSIIASIYVTQLPSCDQRVGLIAHYPGSGTRKWALVFHNSCSSLKLSLLDENIAGGWVAENPCTLNYNAWYKFNFTISGKRAWGSATAPGISCNVSSSFTSNDITSATGFGLYAGGQLALYDNVTVTTVVPSITGTSFSNSFIPNGAPGSSVHGALAGTAEFQNGTGTLPIEAYYGYYSWGGLNQQKNRLDQGATQWLTSTRTYGTYGNLQSFTDARGNTTLYGYSSKYQSAYLTSKNETLVPGGTLISNRYSYNFTMGTMTSEVDPNGYNTTYKYDILSRPTGTTYPNNNYVAYTYNDLVNYVNVTNENGWLTQQKYDGLGRLAIADRFLNGNLYSNQMTAYNWQDKTVISRDPIGNTYNYTYDALGRITSSITPDRKIVNQTYNDLAAWVQTRDQDGNYRCDNYDRLGRLISVVEYTNTDCTPKILNGYTLVTNYHYDEVGNLRMVTSAATTSTLYSYDNLNRMTSTSYPDGTFENYSYDNSGNPVSKTNRNNVQTNYGYDSLNRPSAIIYHGITVTGDNYTYDGDGNLLKLTSQNATLTYNYDSRNRVTGETYSINGGHVTGPLASPFNGPSVPRGTLSSGYSFTYSYTGETLAQITYNDFMTTGYTYDNLGRVASVRINTATSHPNATTFSYYPNDRMKGIVFGNGLVANYTYDPVSRPVQLTLKDLMKNPTITLLALTYSYNNTGTVKWVIGGVNWTSINEEYGYDPLRRLTNSLLIKGSATTTLSYVYDSVGNRQSQTTNGPTTISYSYNPSNNELTSSTWYSSHYAYYPTGSLKQWNYTLGTLQTRAYSWDFPGNLVKFVQNGSLQAAYAYDGLGRRVESEEGSTVTFYAYLGAETMAERAPSGADTDYVYANGLRIARVTGAGGVTPTIVYYHEDALGSTRLVTSSTKTVLFSDNYQPYGLDNGAPTGSETYRFTGKPVSATTGLYYEYARWYDPTLGRFISSDPKHGHLSDPQSLNRYVYVENLPTVLTDPTGAAWWCDGETACEGDARPVWNESPLTQEELDSIKDPQIRQGCMNNPGFCRGYYVNNDEPTPTGGDITSPGSGEPATTTVTASDTPTIRVDANPTTELTTSSATGRVVAIGEDMTGRVEPFASQYGYDTMPRLSDELSTSEKLSANRAWIRGCMDEGCTIVDVGPAPNNPNYTDYPYISSPFYAVEQAELAARNYARWIMMWGVLD